MTVLMAARVYNRHNREAEKTSLRTGRHSRSDPMSGGASTNPGLYPGNPSLPKEVREKILSTFRHTLNLFQQGNVGRLRHRLRLHPQDGPALLAGAAPAREGQESRRRHRHHRARGDRRDDPRAPAAPRGRRGEAPDPRRRELQRPGLRRLHQRGGAGPDGAAGQHARRRPDREGQEEEAGPGRLRGSAHAGARPARGAPPRGRRGRARAHARARSRASGGRSARAAHPGRGSPPARRNRRPSSAG